jgi:hypothetical protein
MRTDTLIVVGGVGGTISTTCNIHTTSSVGVDGSRCSDRCRCSDCSNDTCSLSVVMISVVMIDRVVVVVVGVGQAAGSNDGGVPTPLPIGYSWPFTD